MSGLAPQAQEITARRPTLRVTLGIHLVAACICAACASHEEWLGPPSALGIIAGVAFVASLLAGLACPIVVLATAYRRGVSWPIANAIIAEAAICFGQYLALLPLVR